MASQFSTTVSINDLQKDATAVLDELGATDQPTAVVRDEHAEAVLMSIGAWKKAEAERELLQRLAQGEAEIAAGLGHDLEALLADADRTLHQRRARSSPACASTAC